MRRVRGDPTAIYTWLLVTLAGVVAALVTGQAVLAVIGWAVGGVAAVVVAAVQTRRSR